ncbi:OprO/OprP family phosphate-selective porin [Alcanivorax sp. S6407]|uniref:porin n=1 Tax=Alcanivorax sp. S6407 TaxID=2926424 RepID=UPI001FF2CF18|nr:porin [Alcanivorax sp. S6407]MCK0155184.1 OprO/OprP family phosphate-selective porin [Alcanivorax sp. S6407]
MFKRTVLAMAISAVPFAAQAAQSTEDLQKQIDILAQEIESLKQEQGGASNPFNKVSLGGYGEIHYNHYNQDPEFGGKQSNDQIDAHRFVLFVGYDFTDSVRFFSEIEIEHSLSGDGKPGEVELEQAYIEVDTSANTKLKMGQFLIPVGIINETHEPDTFYGVERNSLEKNIIPATWWEAGAMFSQDLGAGLTYDVALHSGLFMDDGTSVRSGRQKVAEAPANTGAATGRVRYVGIPGLDLASSIQYQQDVNQDDPDRVGLEEVSGRLVEAHARYSIAGVTATVQKARWDFNGFEGTGADRQEGELYELSYKLTDKLGFFGRYENINLVAEGGNDTSEQMISTYGVNYWIVPQVVVKADVQNVNYKNPLDDDKAKDTVNLGIGWSF